VSSLTTHEDGGTHADGAGTGSSSGHSSKGADGGGTASHQGSTVTTTEATGVTGVTGVTGISAGSSQVSSVGSSQESSVSTGGQPDAAMGCPATAPMSGATCTDTGGTCPYGALTCDCNGFGGRAVWACRTTCPNTMPAQGATCVSAMGGFGGGGGGGACTYGATDCACTNNAWACSSCPTAEPANMSTCTVDGETCTYDGGMCRCRHARGMGGGMGGGAVEWECGGGMMTGPGMCPATQPGAGDLCVTGETCPYTADGGAMITCTCGNVGTTGTGTFTCAG
jgi:hypothetical protein